MYEGDHKSTRYHTYREDKHIVSGYLLWFKFRATAPKEGSKNILKSRKLYRLITGLCAQSRSWHAVIGYLCNNTDRMSVVLDDLEFIWNLDLKEFII